MGPRESEPFMRDASLAGGITAGLVGWVIAPLVAAGLYALTEGVGNGIALPLVALVTAILYPVSLPFLIVTFVRRARLSTLPPSSVWLGAALAGLAHPVLVVGVVAALDRLAASTTGIGPAPRLIVLGLVIATAGMLVSRVALWMTTTITKRRSEPLAGDDD